jgi:hypothetical protein
VTPAEQWLRERLPAAPSRLLEAMIAALPASATSVPDALAEGALTLYAEVLRGTGCREDALPLLAADALLTHTFQELDPAGIPELARRCGGAGRLGELAEAVVR